MPVKLSDLREAGKDLDATLKEAVEAFLGGHECLLREIEHREEIAWARRRLFMLVSGEAGHQRDTVLEGGKGHLADQVPED